MPKPKPGTGKKPKVSPAQRYPSGDPKPQPASGGHEPLAPTLIKRLKDEILPRARDKRLGTVLGLMHLEGILSERETEAGFRFAEDVGAFERITGAPRRHSQSPSFEGGFKGAGGVDLDALRRMDPEAADKLERRIRRKNKAIRKRYDAARAHVPDFPHIASTILETVCCDDRRVHSVHHAGLKVLLGNLANHYGIAAGSEKVARRRISKSADAATLAQAAVDAIEAWFRTRKAEVATFRLAVQARGTSPAITAYGAQPHSGAALSHTIRLKRSQIMFEEINAQLLKAAEAKGWKEAGKSGTGEAA